MADTAGTIRISQVGTVFVPVADQDRALDFYLGVLGFEKRADFPYGEGRRWVEVAPPGSAMAIALVPPSEGQSAGGDRRAGLTVLALRWTWLRRQTVTAAAATSP